MRVFFRKLAILGVAYALALQPVMAAISYAHTQAHAELCATGNSGGIPGPASTHDNDCCLAMGCTASAAAPSPVFTIVPAFNVAFAPLAAARPAPRIELAGHGLPAARAPPV